MQLDPADGESAHAALQNPQDAALAAKLRELPHRLSLQRVAERLGLSIAAAAELCQQHHYVLRRPPYQAPDPEI